MCCQKNGKTVFPTIYNFSGSSSMTKPKSYVPKERTPAQQAILDKARERAHAVLREKNKIVKSMKTEEEETQEKKEELVEEKQEEEKRLLSPSSQPEAKPNPPVDENPHQHQRKPEPVREPEPFVNLNPSFVYPNPNQKHPSFVSTQFLGTC